MKLSQRLKAAAELVAVRTCVADVGTDHGFLPVWLCREGRIRRAIAMDLREGPLARAQAHIHEAGLDGQIETRLSDGLAALAPGEADSAVITGMGGILISRILRQSPLVVQSLQELVLGPQSDAGLVRRTLEEMRFAIERETALTEDGKTYVLIRAVPDAAPRAGGTGGERLAVCPEKMTEEEAAFGPYLLRTKDPVLYAYLQQQLHVREALLEKLGGRDGAAALRREKIEEERQLIEAAVRRYEL